MTLTSLFLTVVAILIAIGVVALIYYLIVWALAQFGLPVPEQPLRIAFVIVVLIIIYMIVSGSFPAVVIGYRG